MSRVVIAVRLVEVQRQASLRAPPGVEQQASVDRTHAHFAEDIVMMAPNMPAVTGADSVAKAMRGFFDAFDVQIRYISWRARCSADTICLL